MRQAKILYKQEEAGILIQNNEGAFTFRYFQAWFKDINKPSISLTFPKTQQEFHSKFLFSLK